MVMGWVVVRAGRDQGIRVRGNARVGGGVLPRGLGGALEVRR